MMPDAGVLSAACVMCRPCVLKGEVALLKLPDIGRYFVRLRQRFKECPNGLHENPECFFRPIHERAKVFQVASQQVGGPAGDRSLEDGPILFGKRSRGREAGVVFDEPEAMQQ